MNKNIFKKAGRKPKIDPAKNRYVFYLNEVDNARFLKLFEQSEMNVKSHFIVKCLFNKPIQVVHVDKNLHEYYMRLTSFYSQYRAVGVNYNQIVKTLKSNFTEKKALALLYKLEKLTKELVVISNAIFELTEAFNQKLSSHDSQHK